MLEANFSAEKREDLNYLITAMAAGIEAGKTEEVEEDTVVVGFETALVNADEKEPSAEQTAETVVVTKSAQPGPTDSTVAVPTPPVEELSKLDGEGLPWDGRIHTTAKSRVKKDDTWKLKRGTDPTLVATVKAELKQAMAATGEPAAAPTPPVSTGEAAVTAPAPPAAAESTAPAPPAPTAPAAMTYSELMIYVVQNYISTGKLSNDQLNALAAELGLVNYTDLANREDLISAFLAKLPA